MLKNEKNLPNKIESDQFQNRALNNKQQQRKGRHNGG